MRKAMCIVMLAACSGGTSATVCKGTVTGQLMGSFSNCDDFDSRYLQNLDTYYLTADYLALPTVFTFSTEWDLTGEPEVKGYNQDTRDITCNITIAKGKLTWVASKGKGAVGSGNCSLDFTVPDGGVSVSGTAGNVTAYHAAGQLRAHLEAAPNTGSTGTVDVTMDFDGSGALR